MQAVSYLAPALAPLAIKLIDKYIFDDQPRAPVPQIIQIPASPRCACRCGELSDGYDSTTQTCSTCAGISSASYRSSNKHRLSTKMCTRSSSTSDAYQKENRKSSRSVRISSDSTDARSEKKSSKHSTNENTLAILAGRLKKEISHQSKGKKSSRDEKKNVEKSSFELKIGKTGSASSSPGSRKCAKSTREKKRNFTVAMI